MSRETLREQMSILIQRRNEYVTLMEYHNGEVIKAKKEAAKLNVRIEVINDRIANIKNEKYLD